MLLAALGACGTASSPSGADAGSSDVDAQVLVELRLFHSADEHGWLHPYESSSWISGGAANFRSWLVERDGFDPDRDLLLSGGDNWTGPAISTWFQGEPTLAAFNAMGYQASVIGNHEFDFGREALEERSSEAEFPFLAANLRYLDSGEQVEFADPWVMLSANGVQVGVIGLAGTHTATTAHPERVADLLFADYADALAEAIPAVREAGADIVVVLAHECAGALEELLEAKAFDVDLAYAAHCHSLGRTDASGLSVVSSGSAWSAYSVTSLTYDTSAGEVVLAGTTFVEVGYDAGGANPVSPDAEIAALVESWQGQVDALLSQEVGYTSAGVANGSWEQANWVTDAWLWAFPNADLALTNFGGLRQSIPSGAFTVEELVGMMPFDNVIYEVELTGAQLIANLDMAVGSCSPNGGCYPAVAGMSFSNAGGPMTVTLASGEAFEPEATYRVLVNDFNYYGGEGYLFQSQDPTPYDTSVNYRQPVIDWTAALQTSSSDPLENYVDAIPRD